MELLADILICYSLKQSSIHYTQVLDLGSRRQLAKQAQIILTCDRQTRDHMTIAIKDTRERHSLKLRVLITWVCIRCNDGLVEDLSAWEIGVQVDVGCQDEMPAVIVETVAKQDQIGGRGDLVRAVGLSRAAAVLGIGRKAEKADYNQ